MAKIKHQRFLTIIIFIAITLFIINPESCMHATSKGLKVWCISVVPALFPFFILTRIIITLNQTSISVLDKFTTKCFHAPNAGLVYFLSIISGYPVGAKLISGYYESGAIDKLTATKMFSFCSTSGPMFIVGTIGIGVFHDAKIGYILLAGHIIGSLLNGMLYRGKTISQNQFEHNVTKLSLNEIMFDSINSILMVGGYIVFSSVVIELLQTSNILPNICNIICKITPVEYDVINSVFCGIIEITNGIIMLGEVGVNLNSKIIICSFLIAFSGICIMMQSSAFLNKISIKKSTILIQKITQAIISAFCTGIILYIIY